MAGRRPTVLVAFAFVLLTCGTGYTIAAQQYLGKFLGKLSELHHGVSGEIYAVDARTLHLKDFTYDGEGPAAYFWAGTSRSPGSQGFRVPDENGSGAVLKRYRRKSVTITLPDGKTLNNIKWFSVWCEEFAVNFGDVKIPRSFDYPKPQKVEGLRGVHGVSSDNIVIVDAQTLLIPNFSYDGEAPDAKFWVGRGSKPSPQGIRIPDENGKEIPLRRYDRKTVVLTLPGDLTVFDIGHFGVWCEAFTVDFGHVRLPQPLNVPPSLKMLGVSPQKRPRAILLPGDPSPNALLPNSNSQITNGAQLEATTYRPAFVYQQQPIQQQQRQHQVYITQQPQQQTSIYQPQNQQQQIYLQQQEYINEQLAQRGLILSQQPNQQYQQSIQHLQQYINPYQQQFAIQRRADPSIYNQQQIYNNQQQQSNYNEQLAYNQHLQQRRLLEEQHLRQQLSKSYNRFDLSG